MTLRDLLERVERATGPDRELSDDVYKALGWTGAIFPGGLWIEPDGPVCEPPKDVTSSVDAALALIGRVLPGCVWTVMTDYELPGRARLYEAGQFAPRVLVQADGPTPALALCAALLAAMIEHEGINTADTPTT